MKRSVAPLAALFLFGVYSLPGKICPSSHTAAVQPTSTGSALPPCHQKASTQPADAPAPCETMVCCLVPDATRGVSADVVLPSPGGVVLLGVSTVSVVRSALMGRPEYFEAQAPPGTWFEPLPSASPRAPPTLV